GFNKLLLDILLDMRLKAIGIEVELLSAVLRFLSVDLRFLKLYWNAFKASSVCYKLNDNFCICASSFSDLSFLFFCLYSLVLDLLPSFFLILVELLICKEEFVFISYFEFKFVKINVLQVLVFII